MSDTEVYCDLDDPVVRARIVTEGPIGHWRTVPGTQPATESDSIEFDCDGSGRLHSWSMVHGPQTESFSWRMVESGVLALRPDPAPVGEAWQRRPFRLERRSGDPRLYDEVYWALRETTGSGFWWLRGPIVPA